MAAKMSMQFVSMVNLGKLDYLIIDLPPGTGDVQLTLAQQASLTGAIIVTTPQNVALGVARKGLQMFQQVNVPILGIVENMSGFTCSHCGKVTPIFKEGGGKALADATGLPYLGAIPIEPGIVESGEEGTPLTLSDKGSPATEAFQALARNLKGRIKSVAGTPNIEPERVELADNGDLLVRWPDGLEGRFTAYDLRVACPCAACVDEDTGQRTLNPKQIPLDIRINKIEKVGRYALTLEFSDHHDTGIYRYDLLRALATTQSKQGPDQESGSFSF
jgi:ATP-binding protein involved in chromosome partitioning